MPSKQFCDRLSVQEWTATTNACTGEWPNASKQPCRGSTSGANCFRVTSSTVIRQSLCAGQGCSNPVNGSTMPRLRLAYLLAGITGFQATGEARMMEVLVAT